jgi:hypothetical protein
MGLKKLKERIKQMKLFKNNTFNLFHLLWEEDDGNDKRRSKDWVWEDINVTFLFSNKFEPLNSFKRSDGIT